MHRPRLVLCLVASVCAAACRPRPAPRPVTPDAAAVSVRDDGHLVFSFFDHRAELRAVERVESVPADVRAEVMVTDPGRSLPGDLIIVADLRKKNSGGQYRAWTEGKGAWLDRVMPKVSLLRTAGAAREPDKVAVKKPKVKIRRKPKKRHVAQAGSEPASAQPQALPKALPKVILFSTAWCPSCKAARQYLQSRRVQFLELDVEKDARAAQQYQAISTAYRLRPGVVPLLVINGRPLQGFSKPQVDAALAAAPAA